MRYSIKTSVAIVIGIEILSMALSRLALRHFPTDIAEVEVFRSVMRLATAGIYWWLLKPVILASRPNLAEIKRPRSLAAIALTLSLPILCGTAHTMSFGVSVLYALTSIVVGIKEEVLFRGIVQNLLETRTGTMWAITGTSVIFTLWHIGVKPHTVIVFLNIFLFSMVLGLMYVRTRSLVAVISLHAVLDAIYCFTPYLSSPLPPGIGLAAILMAIGLLSGRLPQQVALRPALGSEG